MSTSSPTSVRDMNWARVQLRQMAGACKACYMQAHLFGISMVKSLKIVTSVV